MDAYGKILLTRIIGYVPIILLGLILAVALVVIIKKMDLPKFLYLLCLVLLFFWGIMVRDWIFIILDFHNESYDTYSGEFEKYTAEGTSDRFLLYDKEETILFVKKAEYADGTYNGIVVYSKRSKIVVDTKLLE